MANEPVHIAEEPIANALNTLIKSVSDVIAERQHQAAVDVSLTFSSVKISQRGFLISRKSENTSVEIQLATRVLPQDGPTFQLQPAVSVLDFRKVKEGRNKSLTLTILNRGNKPLLISSIALERQASSSHTRPFILEESPNPNTTIEPGKTAHLTVRFQPFRKTVYSAKLIFEHNAVGSPSIVRVQGQGV